MSNHAIVDYAIVEEAMIRCIKAAPRTWTDLAADSLTQPELQAYGTLLACGLFQQRDHFEVTHKRRSGRLVIEIESYGRGCVQRIDQELLFQFQQRWRGWFRQASPADMNVRQQEIEFRLTGDGIRAQEEVRAGKYEITLLFIRGNGGPDANVRLRSVSSEDVVQEGDAPRHGPVAAAQANASLGDVHVTVNNEIPLAGGVVAPETEVAGPQPVSGTATKNQRSNRGGRPSGTRKTINDRITELLESNPASAEWSAKQFATHLDCSDGTVKGTAAWETLQKAREMAKLRRQDSS